MRRRESRITSYEPLNEPLPDNWQSETAGGERSSVVLILGATVVAGVAGYVVTWRVASTIGSAGYAVFSVFWSALFLVVGILFGLQQESTRAVAETANESPSKPVRASLWRFSAAVALVVVAVVLVTSFVWAPPSLGVSHLGLVWFVAAGAGLNCLVAAASGILAGAGLWRYLAMIVALDGILRVIGVLAVLAVSHDVLALAVVVILPFPLSLLIVFAFARGRLIVNAKVSIGVRRLIANTGQTMLAASATAVLINGFPLVLSFFSTNEQHAELGALILSITLTRAPILVPLMALSSFLVTQFSRRPDRVGRLMGLLLAAIAVIIAILSLVTWAWGPEFMRVVFGAEFAFPPGVLVPLVASSGLIGALCVSGAAVLARGLHGAYALGWVVASLVSIALLFLPIDLPARSALALAVGPAVGLVVHLVWLRVRRPDAATAPASSSLAKP
jgi:O-antigen/teichoic acid export membrane protein